MSLVAISKPKAFFQTCQIRAIPYETNDEYLALHKLGLFNKGEKTKYAQFNQASKQHPNISRLSGYGFASTITHESVATDNPNLLKRIIKLHGKVMLELGTSLSGETPLFAITNCKKYSTIKTLIKLGANVNAISLYANDEEILPQHTVLENYVLNLTVSVEQRMRGNQNVINKRDMIKTTEKCALKLLLSRGACIQNDSYIKEWMRDYLVEQWHEVQSETEQLVQLVIKSLNNLPAVLHALIINYVIPPSETLNAFIRQIKKS